MQGIQKRTLQRDNVALRKGRELLLSLATSAEIARATPRSYTGCLHREFTQGGTIVRGVGRSKARRNATEDGRCGCKVQDCARKHG